MKFYNLHPDAWHKHVLTCPKWVDVLKKKLKGFRFKARLFYVATAHQMRQRKMNFNSLFDTK